MTEAKSGREVLTSRSSRASSHTYSHSNKWGGETRRTDEVEDDDVLGSVSGEDEDEDVSEGYF